jgi:predicted RNA-binding Zn-ribbon protein involved in translation (DUF1610 family)
MMLAGIEFEAACGLRDEAGQVYIHDGLHRGEAAKAVGKLLLVEVKPGTKLEAEWLALTANQKHGLRRSREDKRRVVHTALLHPYGARLSNREIGRHCGVDHKTVGKIRQELELSGEIPQIQTRTVTRAGATYEQDTSQIGQRSPGSVGLEPGSGARVKPTVPGSNGIEAANGSRQSDRDPTPTAIPVAEEQARYEPHAQDFECPRCGQEKVVGVNGSRRWCLGCGAEWPTATSFLAEIEISAGAVTTTVTRTQLQHRFAALLADLADEQLSELEGWLADMETKLAHHADEPVGVW